MNNSFHAVYSAKLATVVAAVVAISPNSTLADILHVPADHPTIQAAIDAAGDGDEIVVAPGTYFELINLDGKAVHLRSSAGPKETILDGQKLGTVITCETSEGPDTIIEGFTVRNGRRTWPEYEDDGEGGGMRNIGSSPTMVNCHFTENEAFVAGHMFNEGGSPTIVDSTFTDSNFVDFAGALLNSNAEVTIVDCHFMHNRGYAGAGAISSAGGTVSISGTSFVQNSTEDGPGSAIYQGSGELLLTNCSFVDNHGYFGGAVQSHSSAVVHIQDCVFDSNTVAERGSAVTNAASIVGTLFLNNKGDLDAGAVTLYDDALVQNCTFIGNFSTSFGAGALRMTGGTIINCVFQHNIAGPGVGLGAVHGSPSVADSSFCQNFPLDISGPWTDAGGNQFYAPADLTCSGSVGVDDLLILLASWGECDECTNCPADLSGDCDVSVQDLLILLENWGS